jgi:hypothetical protein
LECGDSSPLFGIAGNGCETIFQTNLARPTGGRETLESGDESPHSKWFSVAAGWQRGICYNWSTVLLHIPE